MTPKSINMTTLDRDAIEALSRTCDHAERWLSSGLPGQDTTAWEQLRRTREVLAGLAEQIMPTPAAANEETWPCERCDTRRTKAEGGTVFTVCDDCWNVARASAGGPSPQPMPDQYGRTDYEAPPDYTGVREECRAPDALNETPRAMEGEDVQSLIADLYTTAWKVDGEVFVPCDPAKLRALCAEVLQLRASAAPSPDAAATGARLREALEQIATWDSRYTMNTKCRACGTWTVNPESTKKGASVIACGALVATPTTEGRDDA